MDIGTLTAKIEIDTSQAHAEIDRLLAHIRQLEANRPWWCPRWLYRAVTR